MIGAFKLTNQERDSALWKRITNHIDSRLDTLRKNNDASLDQQETERLRGRISAFKELLALGNEDLLK
jgi:hypothetical protein